MEPETFPVEDPVTEEFHRVWVAARQRAAAAVEAEIEAIKQRVAPFSRVGAQGQTAGMMWNPRGFGLTAVRGEEAYRWFTGFAQEIEAVLRDRLGKRTSDVWLLQSRRALSCRLLSDAKAWTAARVTVDSATDQLLGVAVGLWARPGNTMLPGADGVYSYVTTEELMEDLEVVAEMLKLHAQTLTERRRLLLGGIVTLGAEPHPVVFLPEHVEHRLSLYGRSENNNLGPFARMGRTVRPMGWGPLPKDQRFIPFCVVGRYSRNPDSSLPEPENASSVRPFLLQFYDSRDIVDALQPFAAAVRAHWGLTPTQIVAAVVALSAKYLEDALDPEHGPLVRYLAESRGVFSADEAFLYQRLEARLPNIALRLGQPIPEHDVARVVRTFLDRCASRPPDVAPLPAADGKRIRLLGLGPVPLLFRAGDKLLLDLNRTLIGLSSLVNVLDLQGEQVDDKGARFEEDVRRALVSADAGIIPVPEMERELTDRDRVVAEVDVAVRCGDTAFVVECKSRRARGIDDCASFEQARKRARKVVDWAGQAHRAAEFLARQPVGPGHEVPADVAFIVPIVCTASREALWQDEPILFLERDRIPIAMTPDDIVAFIVSRRWTDREAVSQYGVSRTGDRAVAPVRKAAVVDPQRPPDHPRQPFEDPRDLAMALMDIGRLDDAEACLEVAARLAGDALWPRRSVAAELNNLAIRLSAAQRFDDAIRLGERATRLFADYPKGHYNLALAYARAGRGPEAIAAYRRVVQLDPQEFKAWSNLGAELARASQFPEAMEASRRALELAPEDSVTMRNLAHLYRGEGWFDRAEALYRKALAILGRSLPADHPEISQVEERLAEIADLTGHART